MGWYTLFQVLFVLKASEVWFGLLNMLNMLPYYLSHATILSMSGLCQESAPARRAAASAVRTLDSLTDNRLDMWTLDVSRY